MKKTVCAGVLLAMLGLLPMNTLSYAADYAASSQHLAAIDVGRIRAVLHLTPQQERYWHPVEAALRQLASREEPESGGFAHRGESARSFDRTQQPHDRSPGLGCAAPGRRAR